MSPIQNRTVFALALALAAGLTSPARAADNVSEKGRAIFKEHQDAILTIQIVVKSRVSMQGMSPQANETRQNLTGTVIDPSGLTVLSLAALDPGAMVQSMMGSDDRIKVETELSDVKMLLDDGVEIQAEVVLRDRDLDLGFVRPKSKLPDTVGHVDLANSAKAEILDPVITLNRLGQAAGRAYSASFERISAIVQRPRLFYIPDANMTTTSLGSPAFTLDGKVLGIFVMRATRGRNASSSLLSSQSENLTSIILPADVILKAAKQAPQTAPPEEKKPEAPADEEKK